MLNAASWGISIEFDRPAPPGEAMTIEFGDSIVAGEVTCCRAAGGAYYIGVKLEQALRTVAALSGLLDDAARPQDSVWTP